MLLNKLFNKIVLCIDGDPIYLVSANEIPKPGTEIIFDDIVFIATGNVAWFTKENCPWVGVYPKKGGNNKKELSTKITKGGIMLARELQDEVVKRVEKEKVEKVTVYMQKKLQEVEYTKEQFLFISNEYNDLLNKTVDEIYITRCSSNNSRFGN